MGGIVSSCCCSKRSVEEDGVILPSNRDSKVPLIDTDSKAGDILNLDDSNFLPFPSLGTLKRSISLDSLSTAEYFSTTESFDTEFFSDSSSSLGSLVVRSLTLASFGFGPSEIISFEPGAFPHTKMFSDSETLNFNTTLEQENIDLFKSRILHLPDSNYMADVSSSEESKLSTFNVEKVYNIQESYHSNDIKSEK